MDHRRNILLRQSTVSSSLFCGRLLLHDKIAALGTKKAAKALFFFKNVILICLQHLVNLHLTLSDRFSHFLFLKVDLVCEVPQGSILGLLLFIWTMLPEGISSTDMFVIMAIMAVLTRTRVFDHICPAIRSMHLLPSNFRN